MAAFHHHQATTDATSGGSTTFGDEREFNSTKQTGAVGTEQSHGTSATSEGVTGTQSVSEGVNAPTSEYPLRTEIPERQGSLSSTPGPFKVPTTDNLQGSSAAVTSSVSSQNAPGAAGEFGEKVMGALGVGGTHVERPREEQGIGEKIVNFLGA